MEGAGFAGDTLVALIRPAVPGPLDRYEGGEIVNLTFHAGGAGIAGIRQHTPLVLNSHFHKLYFNTPYGIIIDSYTQKCLIENLYSFGLLEQFIHLRGNENVIQNIDKEGGVGSSTLPLIKIDRHLDGVLSSANYLRKILLEGNGLPNKTYIELNGCTQCVLDGIWAEAGNMNGKLLDIIDSNIVQIKGSIVYVTDKQRIHVTRSKGVVIEQMSTDGVGGSLWSYLKVDALSSVHIRELETRRGGDLYKLQPMQNVKIDRHFASRLDPSSSLASPGWMAETQVQLLAGQNLLMNPSFEAGRYGWLFSGSGGQPSSENYVTSEVGAGLMADYSWAAGDGVVYQNVNIPQALVGRAMTFTIKVKIDTQGQLMPFVSGAGLTRIVGFHGVSANTGWQVISQTLVPKAAGTLAIGVATIAASAATRVYLDDASFSFGTVGAGNMAKFASMELGPDGGNTQTYAISAPTYGTWKAGDIVFNKAPASGQPVGWVCVTAGTPGVWRSFGIIN
jgi:hypothetical protein